MLEGMGRNVMKANSLNSSCQSWHEEDGREERVLMVIGWKNQERQKRMWRDMVKSRSSRGERAEKSLPMGAKCEGRENRGGE